MGCPTRTPAPLKAVVRRARTTNTGPVKYAAMAPDGALSLRHPVSPLPLPSLNLHHIVFSTRRVWDVPPSDISRWLPLFNR